MAITGTAVSAGPQHFVWWFPGSPVKVHLNLQVVQRLQERIRDNGSGTIEDGLLFGRVRDGASEVLDFQPAIDTTVANMLTALSDECRRSLIGYYRTEDEGTFHLTTKDIALAEEAFPNPYHVFLMIQANGFGPPNATFFFRDTAGRMSNFAFLEFPFDRSQLEIEEHGRMQRSTQAAIEQPAVLSLPAPILPPAAIRPSDNRRRSKVVAWTCFGVLMLASGVIFNQKPLSEWRSLLAPSRHFGTSLPSLALHATRRDGDLELTWSRESALISSAVSGVISIHDGESKRLVSLDSTQIRGGSLLYSPISDQVEMQLAVQTPASTVTESVMVILPKIGGLQTYSVGVPTTSSNLEFPTPPAQAVQLAKASKPFVPSSPTLDPSSPVLPAMQDLPALRINPPASTIIDGTPQAPAPPPNPVRLSLQEQQPQTPLDIATYEPPMPVLKTMPAFPRELQNLAVKQTIQVKVDIDKNGKVIKAEAIALAKNVSKFLVNSAIEAARSWKFQPAQRNHVPIPSQSVLQFDFSIEPSHGRNP